jgi:hypothetical protein
MLCCLLSGRRSHDGQIQSAVARLTDLCATSASLAHEYCEFSESGEVGIKGVAKGAEAEEMGEEVT